MQKPTTSGLAPAEEDERRCEIIPIHNATNAAKDQLIAMWAERTPEEAKDVLNKWDVQVTNKSDKPNQLKKLDTLNDVVRKAYLEFSERQEEPTTKAGMGVATDMEVEEMEAGNE